MGEQQRIHPARQAVGLVLFVFALHALGCQLAADWFSGLGYTLYAGIPLGLGHVRALAQSAAVMSFLTALILLVPPLFNRLRHRVVRGIVKGTVIALLWVISIMGVLTLLLITMFTPIYILHGFSHPGDGRRILVVEKSMLLLGAGSVYQQVWGPIYQHRHTYMADDGATPIEKNRYDIEWSDNSVVLHLTIEGSEQVERVPLAISPR